MRIQEFSKGEKRFLTLSPSLNPPNLLDVEDGVYVQTTLL